jgi:squalene cyclase
MKDTRIFALYKGDTYITQGTIREIAKYRGCTERTISFYLTDSYQKRLKNMEKNRKRRSKGNLVLVYLDEGTWGYGWDEKRRKYEHEQSEGFADSLSCDMEA